MSRFQELHRDLKIALLTTLQQSVQQGHSLSIKPFMAALKLSATAEQQVCLSGPQSTDMKIVSPALCRKISMMYWDPSVSLKSFVHIRFFKPYLMM